MKNGEIKMTGISKNGYNYFEKIRNIKSFGDLFNLQLAADSEFKSNGIETALTITDQMIEAVKSSSDNIPFIKDVFKMIFDRIRSESEIENKILDKLDRYVRSEEHKYLRAIALDILSEYRFDVIAPEFVRIACDEKEKDEIRVCCLQYLLRGKSEKINFSLLLEILKQKDEKIALSAMNVLACYKDQAPFKETQAVLEQIFRSSPNNALRCRAVELLGIFGELDTVERICMLPLADSKLQESVHKMLQHIISKPRNILYIRPESFEYLMGDCLTRLGYEQVEVTRAVKDDGVDVIAYKDGGIKNQKYKIIVQCKRYAKDSIGTEVLEQLIEKLQKHSAKEGQLITTSCFSKETKKLAENHRYIELLDRDDLQKMLDKVYGKNLYCIISRN